MPDKNELNEDVIQNPFDDDEDDENWEPVSLEEIEAMTRAYQDYQDRKEDLEDKKENISNKASYELVLHHGLAEGEKPLEKVIGHESQKKELLSVIEWFKKSKELKAKGVSIPKGVVLFGEPGNGKSLLIKEIIRCIDAPVFILKGDETNIVAGITETFAKARETGHAVVVIDELDLLINKERRVIRALQENLDGVESSDDI